jgi:hypothetical protein
MKSASLRRLKGFITLILNRKRQVWNQEFRPNFFRSSFTSELPFAAFIFMRAQGLPVLEAAHLLHLSACLPPAQGSLEVEQAEHRRPSVTVGTVVRGGRERTRRVFDPLPGHFGLRWHIVFRRWVGGEPGPLSLKREVATKKAQKTQGDNRRSPRDKEGHRILAGGETTDRGFEKQSVSPRVWKVTDIGSGETTGRGFEKQLVFPRDLEGHRILAISGETTGTGNRKTIRAPAGRWTELH